MFKHYLVPCWDIWLFSIFVFNKTERIEEFSELMMGFSNNASKRLKITNIQSTTRSFDKNFIKKGFDHFALCFLYVVPCKTCETCCNHVPSSNCLFRVQVSRWCPKRIYAQRQSFASQGRPNSNLTVFQKFAFPFDITITIEQF